MAENKLSPRLTAALVATAAAHSAFVDAMGQVTAADERTGTAAGVAHQQFMTATTALAAEVGLTLGLAQPATAALGPALTAVGVMAEISARHTSN